MADILACPDCQRSVHLPRDYHLEIARCPSCGAEFPLPPAVLPAAVSTSFHPADSPPPARRRMGTAPNVTNRAARGPSRASRVIVLSLLGVAVLAVVFGGVVLGLLVFRSRSVTPPP